MQKKLFLIAVVVLGSLLLAACATPTPEIREVEVTREVTKEVPVEVTKIVEVKPAGGVPYEELWKGSAHNAVDTEPFRRWDDADPAEVPTTCAKCHTSAGYLDFLGADGSEAGTVDAAVPAAEAQGIVCTACHDPAATNLTAVAFPGKTEDGEPIVVSGLTDAARCMVCHQGRASKASVDGAIERFAITDVDAQVAPIKDQNGNEVKFGFINIHYFAAAATLYGGQVKGGYEYDGKLYDAKFRHVDGFDTCIGCHDQHSLKVKVEKCAACHEGVATVEDLQNVRMVSSASDYDGDGDVEEGVASEVAGLQEILLAEIQKYAAEKAGAEISYDPATYPYFLGADGAAYPNWTARLLKAAYNYQVSQKDPGKFAHGGKYVIQLMHDSIEDLGGDVSGLAREDAAHFAGDTMPFRNWDETGTVPYNCAKCHSDSGLPQFIANGGTVTFNARGSVYQTGVGSQPSANGFKCVTCHNPAAGAFSAETLYAVASVPFPSGATVGFEKDAEGKFVANNSNLCIECHQGRESTATVDAALRGKDLDTVDNTISFKNIHYFAAGATLFGDLAKGMYQYTGQTYNGQFMHFDLGPNQCAECHNVHELGVKVDMCAQCHKTVETIEDVYAIRAQSSEADYDGDGDTDEGIKGELEGMEAVLYEAIKAYATKAGTGIVYNPGAYPYFFVDQDGDGQPDKNDSGASIRYNAFTPRLLKAAFNYQYAHKDPGAFTHNGQYVLQGLYDSIKDLGGDVSQLTRPEVK